MPGNNNRKIFVKWLLAVRAVLPVKTQAAFSLSCILFILLKTNPPHSEVMRNPLDHIFTDQGDQTRPAARAWEKSFVIFVQVLQIRRIKAHLAF